MSISTISLKTLLAICLWVLTQVAFAQDTAQILYARYSPSIYQIEVLDPTSDNKESLGTGFVVVNERLLASNFHVIAAAVHEPENYRLEWLSEDGRRGELEVVAIDVVHDLSLLRAKENLGTPLVSAPLPQKGAALYSMGHPLALDLSIVTGTANGLLEKSLYEKIHFSGSINPGMSGGPALDDNGRVVGVNVATAGDSVGFLVPASYLDAMIDLARARNFEPLLKARPVITQQLMDNQNSIIDELLENEWSQQSVGKFLVPSKLSSHLDCWGDTTVENDEETLHRVAANCSGQDSIFLSDRQRAGQVSYQFFWYASEQLSTDAFYRRYQSVHSSSFLSGATKEDVGNFQCVTRFLTVSEQTFKANICARPYKRYPGLNDFMVMMAMTGREREGFMFFLDLSSVTLDNAMNLYQRFLENMQWQS